MIQSTRRTCDQTWLTEQDIQDAAALHGEEAILYDDDDDQ